MRDTEVSAELKTGLVLTKALKVGGLEPIGVCVGDYADVYLEAPGKARCEHCGQEWTIEIQMVVRRVGGNRFS